MKSFIIILIASFTAAACTSKKTFERHFEEKIYAPELNQFVLVAEKKSSNSTQAEFSAGAAFLLVKSSAVADNETKNATQFLETQLNAVFQIYSTHETPYAGILSKNIDCAEEYIPREVKFPRSDVWLRGVELYANDRRVFGSCSSASAKYKALYLGLLCQKKNIFYEIILFTLKEQTPLSTQKIMESLTCI